MKTNRSNEVGRSSNSYWSFFEAIIAIVQLGVAVCWVQSVQAAEADFAEVGFPKWSIWFDMGGTIPEDANLTELGTPVSGEEFQLDPGFQFDMGFGYRPLDWLVVGPELGFTYNGIHSVGQWSYPNSMLGQILMMANVRIEYPHGRLAPFIGAGVGGAASFLTFGGGGSSNDYYYDYDEPDGTGADFASAFQVFGGLRYRMSGKWNLGVEYRYFATDKQHWDVDWRYGRNFGISVDSIRMHYICLVISADF
jgi:opacity protein-like surface antigen